MGKDSVRRDRRETWTIALYYEGSGKKIQGTNEGSREKGKKEDPPIKLTDWKKSILSRYPEKGKPPKKDLILYKKLYNREHILRHAVRIPLRKKKLGGFPSLRRGFLFAKNLLYANPNKRYFRRDTRNDS